MTRTLVFIVCVPLGAHDNANTTARVMAEHLDGCEEVSNLRLAEASYATTNLGVRAAMIDAVSYMDGGLSPRSGS